MVRKCVNHEAYFLGSECFVQHEDEHYLEVGDEAVLGVWAYRVTAREFQEWGGWGFILDAATRIELRPAELREVFARCPHHTRRAPA